MRSTIGTVEKMTETMELERRCWPVTEVRVADITDGEKLPVLSGHAAVFDKLSEPMFGFRERIEPGAFAASLKAGDEVVANVEHKGGLSALGNTKSKTLRLTEDDRGLAVEVNPPDTQAGRDVVALVKRGDLRHMSFAFGTVNDRWETKDGEEIRTLEKVQLFDVSIVSQPAYKATDVTVAKRSLESRRAEQAKEAAARQHGHLRRRLVLAEAD